jgi:hypothetical protein
MAYTLYSTARQGRAISDIEWVHANLGCGKVDRRSDFLATTHVHRNSTIAEQRLGLKLR